MRDKVTELAKLIRDAITNGDDTPTPWASVGEFHRANYIRAAEAVIARQAAKPDLVEERFQRLNARRIDLERRVSKLEDVVERLSAQHGGYAL